MGEAERPRAGATPQAAPRPRSEALIVTALFALALLVRLIYLYESSHNPTFDAPLIDSETYHRLAGGMAGGQGLTDEFFWQPFFYPAFLSLVYALTGSSMLWAKILQLMVGAATSVLTYRLGKLVFDRPAGLVAGVIVALYGPLIFFDGELLATGWAAFWSVALLLLLLESARKDRVVLHATLGVSAGLAVLTRPTYIPFLAVAIPWLALTLQRRTPGRRATLRRLATILAGFLVVSLPVAALSRQYSGRFSILPASSGINLYIGNNPDAARTITIRPGWDWTVLTRLPGQHGVERKQDTSRFFRGQFLDYVRSEPAGFVKGLAAKTGHFISSRELPRNVELYLFREWSRTLSLLVWKVGPFGFPFGVLLPLAALGLIHRWRRVPWPVLFFLSLYPASIVVVFVSARYRAPVVPAMAVLAAAGAVALFEAVRRRRWGRLANDVTIVAALVLLASLPGPFPQERTDYRAELLYGLGIHAQTRGELDQAVDLLGQALDRDPSHSDAHNVLGNTYARQGRLDLAAEHYRKAIEANPRDGLAHGNLARLLMSRGSLGEAMREFRLALETDPNNPSLHHDYGKVLAVERRLDEAADHLARALEIEPDDADARDDLGKVFLLQNRSELAAREFRAALVIDALHRGALDNLVATLRKLGRPDEAARVYQEALLRARIAGEAALAERIERQLHATAP